MKNKNDSLVFQIRINPPNPRHQRKLYVCGAIQVCTFTPEQPDNHQCFSEASSATLSLNMIAKNSITTNAKPAGNHQN